MNLRQLRSLVAVLDSGSFAAAGDRIGLSHAAISVQMQQLETTLGAALFDRSNRPARLTRTGVRIAQLAGEVLARIENIKLEAIGAETEIKTMYLRGRFAHPAILPVKRKIFNYDPHAEDS